MGIFLFVKIGSELHLMVGKFENGAPNTWIVAQSCAYLVGQSLLFLRLSGTFR